jgi:DNA-binding NarL/FixJ family response regulator
MQPRDRLTAKEIQVATLVWQGLTNKGMAGVLLTSEQVVKNYLRTASTSWECGPGWNSRSTWAATAAPTGICD